MRLSEQIKEVLTNGSIGPDPRGKLNEWAIKAERMEAALDRLPRQRSGEQYWDGDVETLQKRQKHLLFVIRATFSYPEPFDTAAMIRAYENIAYGENIVDQTHQSLRSRAKELENLGVIEYVDRNGVSPTGRPAKRWRLTRRAA